VFNTKDWQDGLRALLPNINISFGGSQGNNPMSMGRPNNLHSQQQKSELYNILQ